jgi:S-adenosylmethionine decarboxylase
MAYDDALFQLGMDLTRSSTAQKEDLIETAPAPYERRDRDTSARCIHLDLIGAKRLASARAVEGAMRDALRFLKAGPVSLGSLRTEPAGCIRALAEFGQSRISVEAWPHSGYVAVDFTGAPLRPEAAMTALADAFGAREVIVRRTRPASGLSRFTKTATAAPAAPEKLLQRRKAAKPSRARAA